MSVVTVEPAWNLVLLSRQISAIVQTVEPLGLVCGCSIVSTFLGAIVSTIKPSESALSVQQ